MDCRILANDKGEKGILILAPIVRRKNESKEQNETDESSTAVGFRAAYVFDISQTDGQELPAIGRVNGDPREHRERLAKFVAEQRIALPWFRARMPDASIVLSETRCVLKSAVVLAEGLLFI
jgi:hypothetical protein